MSHVLQDIRFALRAFGKNRGYTAATVLVLGIGIGSVSLMFSTLNTVVLQPLPLEQPEQLVWLWSSSEANPTNSVAYLDYADYRDGVDAYESLAAMGFQRSAILTGGDAAERVATNFVSSNFFSTMGGLVAWLEEKDKSPVPRAEVTPRGSCPASLAGSSY